MAIVFFRMLGGITLYFLAGLLFVGLLSNGRYSLHINQMSRTEIVRFVFGCAILLALGLGLFFLRKWAALAFSAASLYWCYETFNEGLREINHHESGEWYWGAFVFAIVLLSPTVLTVKYWRALKWREALSPRRAA